MSKKLKNEVEVNQGIRSTVSGSIDNLIFTKKGVIYFKDLTKRKKTSKT